MLSYLKARLRHGGITLASARAVAHCLAFVTDLAALRIVYHPWIGENAGHN